MIDLKYPGDPRGKFSLINLPMARELMEEKLPVLLRIGGDSMDPFLRKGDLIEVVPPDHLKIGDLIVFRHEEQFICHRLCKIREDGMVETQGDRSHRKDIPIPMENILGKVERRRPGRRAVGFAKREIDSWVRKAAEVLKRNFFGNAVLRSFLFPQLKFFLSYRPLRALEGYEEFQISPKNLSASVEKFPPGTIFKEIFLTAKLKNISLASINLKTQELMVRRLFSNLDLEETLQEFAGTLKLCLEQSQSFKSFQKDSAPLS